MINKRNFMRYVIEANVRFKTTANVSKDIQGQILDICSLGWGAFFKESIEVNTIIQFDLTTDLLDEHLKGSGRVVYTRQQKSTFGSGFRIGVEFIEVDKDTVLRFISEQQRVNQQRQAKAAQIQLRKQTDIGLF